MENPVDLKKTGEKNYSLDVRGLTCPYPQIIVRRALKSLISGDNLEVLLNNPPSVRDIPIALKDSGYNEIDVSNIEEGTWKIIIKI